MRGVSLVCDDANACIHRASISIY